MSLISLNFVKKLMEKATILRTTIFLLQEHTKLLSLRIQKAFILQYSGKPY